MFQDFLKTYFRGKNVGESVDELVHVLINGDPDTFSFLDLIKMEFVILNINEFERLEYSNKLNCYRFFRKEVPHLLCNNNIDPLSILPDNFVQLKKHNLVNLKKIACYNSYKSIIYFDNKYESDYQMEIPLTAMKKYVMNNIVVGKHKDIYEETDIEYFPMKKRTKRTLT